MKNKLQVTELDYDQIKQNLISFLKRSDNDFSDWDFEGSNFNILLDVLAYNTHYNAHLANMSINESFIDGAQLRSSVAAIAKALGYVPSSMTAASVSLEFEAIAVPDAASSIILPRGTRIIADSNVFGIPSTSENSLEYTLLDEFVSLKLENGVYTVDREASNDFKVYQGRLITTRFPANGADNSTRYEISDLNIDISTLTVKVYPNNNITSGTAAVYTHYKGESGIDRQSLIYLLTENSSGRYEIQFGNDSFGRALRSGEVIEISYLITQGSVGNGYRGNFTMVSPPSDIIKVNVCRPVRDDTDEYAPYGTSGGADRESLEQLKQNATGQFIAQRRAVTADDYRALLLSNFPYLRSVSVWGGEDNVPPVYGKTFFSAFPKSDYASGGELLTDEDKAALLDYLRGHKVLSILPELVDPFYIDIVLDIKFKYDVSETERSRSDLINTMRDSYLPAYSEKLLESYNSIFRHSEFTADFDSSVPGILNSSTEVYIHKKLVIPSTGYYAVRNTYPIIPFGTPLTSNEGSSIHRIVTNIPWTINGERIYVADQPSSNPDVYNIFTYIIDGNGARIFRQYIGLLTLSSGELTFIANLFADQDTIIDFYVIPRSRDIVGARQTVLRIDSDESVIRGYADEIASRGVSRSTSYKTFDRE